MTPVAAPAGPVALPARLLVLVFVPFSAGFFLSFLFRNANAVISKDLGATFSLSSSELGLLTSAYFLAFAAMQMPVGIFLDRYGPRRVTSGLLLVLAAGAATFAGAEGLGTLTLGRALIGVGASACLMGSMKAYSIWFPLDRMATLNGWTMAIGALGAVAATAPVEFVASLAGWRAMFGGLAAFTVAVAAGMFLLVPEKAVAGANETWGEQAGKIASIFRVPAFWRMGTPMIVMQGTYQALFGLWLVPWLIDTQDLSRSTAAQWLMAAALTYAIASIFFGQGSDRFAERGVPRLTLIKWGAGLAVAAFFALAYAPGVPKLAAPRPLCLRRGRPRALLPHPFAPFPDRGDRTAEHRAQCLDVRMGVHRADRHGNAAATVPAGGRALPGGRLRAGLPDPRADPARGVDSGRHRQQGARALPAAELAHGSNYAVGPASGAGLRLKMAAIHRPESMHHRPAVHHHHLPGDEVAFG